MSSYVGPNGRIYKRKRDHRVWVALTILSVLIIAAVLAGFPSLTEAVRYAGL